MKCPCCGKKMELDNHTKIEKYMCYDCGYMEGRRMGNVTPINYSFKNRTHAKVYGNNKFSRFMERYSA